MSIEEMNIFLNVTICDVRIDDPVSLSSAVDSGSIKVLKCSHIRSD